MDKKTDQWIIEIYQDASGKMPFLEWIKQIEFSFQPRIYARIDRLKSGNFGDHKLIGDGIYELRIHFGSGYRVYFGKIRNKIILLFSGGDKKTQHQDIEKAKRYLSDYIGENHEKISFL